MSSEEITNNERRRQRFAQAMKTYMDLKDGDGDSLSTISQDSIEEEITNFMADMHHWHREQFGEPAPDVYAVALDHYETERIAAGESL